MAEYNLGRVAFFDKGAYSPEETYNKWDFVTTVDSTYLFVGTTPQIGKPVTDTLFWKCIANGKPATLAAAAADLAKEAANSSATLANDKAVLAQSAATLANTKAGLANDAAVLATEKAALADSKATLANDKAALAQSAADNANAKAAEVTAAVLSAGQLGSIKTTDAAPTPARNGNYTFSIGGNKPAWLTVEPLVTTVKAGDGVAVVFTAPSSYSYTHIDNDSEIEQTRSQSTSKVPSSKLVDDELTSIGRTTEYINRLQSDLGANLLTSWTLNKFISTGDQEADFGKERSYVGFKYSNKVYVTANQTLPYNGKIEGNAGVVFYDENDTPLVGVDRLTNRRIVVPDNSDINYMLVNDRSGAAETDLRCYSETGIVTELDNEVVEINRSLGTSFIETWVLNKIMVSIQTESDFGEPRTFSGFKYSNPILCNKLDEWYYNGEVSGNAGVVFFDVNGNAVYSLTGISESTIVVPDNDTIHYMIVNDRSGAAEGDLLCYIKASNRVDIQNLYFEDEEINRRLIRQEEANPFVWKSFDKAYFSFTHDDARTDWDAMIALLQEYSFPFCPAVPFESMGRKTLQSQCQQIIADGGEILAHGFRPLSGDDDEEVYRHYFRDNKKTFEDLGISISTFIMIGGTPAEPIDYNYVQKWSLRYFDMSDKLGTTPQYTLSRSRPSDGSTEQQQIDYFIATVDDAIANNKWVRFYTHNFAQTTEVALRALFDYIEDKIALGQCNMVTWKYMFETFKSSKLEEL